MAVICTETLLKLDSAASQMYKESVFSMCQMFLYENTLQANPWEKFPGTEDRGFCDRGGLEI